MASSWIEYWNRQNAMTGDLWTAQAAFFVRQVCKELPFQAHDVLLDVGCGAGHVTAMLAPMVQHAYGADTSAHCVEQAASSHAAIPNLRFLQLPPEDYTALDKMPLSGVTRILCVSVLQYYKSPDEIRSLVHNAKAIAAPGCRMLLADLLVDYALWKDVAGVLLGGLASGTFLAKLKELVSGNHSVYKATRSQNPVLTLGRDVIPGIAAAEGLKCRFIPANLTGNYFRAHALLEFP